MAALSNFAALALGTVCLTDAARGQVANPALEGDWYVSDTTDNNTGEREVYAFTSFFGRANGEYVTLKMRCSKGAPIVSVEWTDVSFPDQAVLSIGAVTAPDAEPAEEPYMFTRSDDAVERGLFATPAISLKIIGALGSSTSATIAAHLSPSTRIIQMPVAGTQRAWSRVARHCPVKSMPRPPQ